MTKPITDVRRKDREVTEEAWIVEMMERAAVGCMATVHDGQPFINSNLFVYDEARHCVYIHTARKGRTRTNVEGGEAACFSIMEMGRLLPAPEALEFSVEYAGVVAFGRSCIVMDEAEAHDALQALLDKYAPHLVPGEDYRPPVPQEIKRTTVIRMDIDQWSAKKKEVEAHEGAFWYEERPVLASVAVRD